MNTQDIFDVRQNRNGISVSIRKDIQSAEIEIPDEIDGVPVVDVEFIAYTSHVSKLIIGSNVSNFRIIHGCSYKYYNDYKDRVAFSNDVEQIIVSERNNSYHVKNNCLIQTNSKILVFGCKTSVIPDDGSVTSIGEYAFRGCSGLASITIPDGVTNIGISAFEGCSGLASIIIPDRVTSIGSAAFAGCRNLASIIIPDGVTSIGISAFEDCYNLASITISDGVTSIGKYAFAGCRNLASITIPDSVVYIDRGTFKDCHYLKCVSIPVSMRLIDHGAFSNCKSLIIITFNGTKKQWKEIAKKTAKNLRHFTESQLRKFLLEYGPLSDERWDEDTGDYTVYCTNGKIIKNKLNLRR